MFRCYMRSGLLEEDIDAGDTILDDAAYAGPNSTTAPTKAAKSAVSDAADALDGFNNNGC